LGCSVQQPSEWGLTEHAHAHAHAHGHNSHAKHHRRTNHLTEGESHVPSLKSENGIGDNDTRDGQFAWMHEYMGDGVFAAFQIIAHLVIGWPLYLLGLASTGRISPLDGKEANGDVFDHFRPYSRMFPKKLRPRIAINTAMIIATLGFLVKLSFTYSFRSVFLWYFAPYLWTNAWLVLYTWLQHTDPSVPQVSECRDNFHCRL